MNKISKIKKGDNAYVRSGKDRGKTGKVLEVLPAKNRLIVENVNMQTRHQRPRRQGQKGEKVSVAMPIHASNVLVQCPSCKEPSRIGFLREENKKKVRVCKRCNSTAE